MSNEIKITLDTCDVQPGQTINGRVDCNFFEQKKIRAIRIKFEGTCYNHWTEAEKYYDDFFKEERTRYVDYNGEEIYFCQEYNLYGDGREMILPAGTYTYPFSYILPPQLPTSYEDMYSRVRYLVKATVDCPWSFDSTAEIILNLVSVLDLNYLPGIQEPARVSVDKTMCSCWCNSSDTLTFTFTLPFIGFIPGQDVQVGCYVENMTNVTAKRVNFKITKLIEAVAVSPSRSVRYTKETVVTATESGIGAHGEKSWTTVLNIPINIKYPNMVPCNLINITYRLKAEIVVPCPHTNLSAFIPITIGDVPFTNTISVNPSEPYLPSASAPPAELVNSSTPAGDEAPSYITAAGAPPPSYEEAQKCSLKNGF